MIALLELFFNTMCLSLDSSGDRVIFVIDPVLFEHYLMVEK